MTTALTEGGEARTPAIRPARRRTALTAAIATIALILTSAAASPAFADDEPAPTAVVTPTDAALSGDLIAGETISVTSSPWAPVSTTLEYEWWTAPQAYETPVDAESNPGAVKLADAEEASLVLPAAAVGQFVWAVVTGSAAGEESQSVVAASTQAVQAADFDPIPGVSIAGAPRVGSILTAALSATLPAGSTVEYQWKRDDVAIDGATASTYVAQLADLDRLITVTASYSAPGYSPAERTSAGVGILIGMFTGAPTPTLTGSVRVGSTVGVSTTGWPSGTTFTYGWRLTDTTGKVTVSTSKASTYKPGASQRGYKLAAVLTAVIPGYSNVVKTTTAVPIGSGVFTTAPTPKISGSPYVGATLKATIGTWAPVPSSYAMRWKRNGVSIPGATKSTYKLSSSDYGKKITFTVVAVKTSYTSKSMTSAPTATITKPFTKVYTPTISGSASVGSTLTAKISAWSPSASFTYQWKRDGAAIAGATKSTYTLTQDDRTHAITVTVVGTRSGYYTRTLTSSATAKVTAPKSLAADGLFLVGIDIAPGTYAAPGGNDCYFERRTNDAVGTGDGILGWTYHWDWGMGGQKVITISSSDVYFYTELCGTWKPVATALKTSVKDGTWVVGKDIKPGVWRVYGPLESDGCYIEFLTAFTGNPDVDIDPSSGSVSQVGFEVRIYSADKGFTTDGCGTWKRVRD